MNTPKQNTISSVNQGGDYLALFIESRSLCYKDPAGRKSDGILFNSFLACSFYTSQPQEKGTSYVLLNNHHQDRKGQGAIKRVQDVARVRRTAAIDVLAVEGVENIAAVCRFAAVERFSVPSIENVAGIVGLSSIDIFAIPRIQDVAGVGGTTFIDVLAVEVIENVATIRRVPAVERLTVPSVQNVAGVGGVTSIEMCLCHKHGT